ncbi:MAG: putative DNA binding domain-containing protein [Acidimicrobiaceae bacterium]|nr:putative DNA binding domain-containing protein [Acidimicrobiaceae bacterium]
MNAGSAGHISASAELQAEVGVVVPRLRAAATDLESVEVKSAAGGFPDSVLKSISAFSNGRGGLLIFGLSDADFLPVPIDAAKLAADLASACSDDLEPTVRPAIGICDVEGNPVVAARIPPQGHQHRPCYVLAEGMNQGSYIRVHDGNRHLTDYEIHVMVSGRGQPADDAAPVDGARLEQLDDALVSDLLRRLRQRRGEIFTDLADHDVLHMLGVLTDRQPDSPVTLAGLLALGRYPQQFVPQLAASFVVLPTMDGTPLADGTRFIDNQPLDGPIPAIVAQAVSAMQRNMRRRSVVEGAGRQDIWDYPTEAIREIVANALMHRDYHPTAQGTQVRISLYPDRLEVASPGGLHGIHAGHTDVAHLIDSSINSTRNALLARLLEDVVIPGTGRPVCENRGSGLRAAVQALDRVGTGRPELDDRVRELVVTVRDQYFRIGVSAIGGSDRIPGAFDHDPWAAPPKPGVGQRAQPQPLYEGIPGQILSLLEAGPRSSVDLAAALATSKQTVLNWLNPLRADGIVTSTRADPQTRGNKWMLVSQPGQRADDR